MKPLRLLLLLATLVGFARAADDEPTPAASYDSESLYIVLIDTLTAEGMSPDMFERYETQIRRAFERHRWPTPLKFERGPFEGPPDSVELVLNIQGLNNDVPGEVRFRTWLTVVYDGGKQDLGLVTATIRPQFGARMDELLDQILFAAGEAILERLEEANLALN